MGSNTLGVSRRKGLKLEKTQKAPQVRAASVADIFHARARSPFEVVPPIRTPKEIVSPGPVVIAPEEPSPSKSGLLISCLDLAISKGSLQPLPHLLSRSI